MADYTIRDPVTGRTITVRGDSPPTEAELEQLFAASREPPPGGAVRAALGLEPRQAPTRDPRETRAGAAIPNIAAMVASFPVRRNPFLAVPVAGAAGAFGQGLSSLLRIANDPIPEGPGLAAVKRLGGETLAIPGEMVREGLRQGAYETGGQTLGALLRGAGNLLRGGSLRPPPLPPPPKPNPNVGGRLAGRALTTEERIAQEIREAVTAAQQRPPAPSVQLPPGPKQPTVTFNPNAPATPPPRQNRGGRLAGRAPTTEEQLANILEEARQAEPPPRVELPPPPGQPRVTFDPNAPTTPSSRQNTGGRLVGRPKTAEEEIREAVEAAQQRPPTPSVQLPPADLPQLPVSYPSGAAPRATVRPAAQPPTARIVLRPQTPAQPPTPAVTPAATVPAASGEVRLPESWKPFAQPPPTTVQTPTPTPGTTPGANLNAVRQALEGPSAPTTGGVDIQGQPGMGLDEDVVRTFRETVGGGDLGDVRRAVGSEKGARSLDDLATDLGVDRSVVQQMMRDTTSGPSRLPMAAELAEMDNNYLRRIMDPSGSVPIKTANWMGRMAGFGSLGQMVGGPPGALLGVALANPKITGKALHLAGRAPYANLFRTALLGQLALEDQ